MCAKKSLRVSAVCFFGMTVSVVDTCLFILVVCFSAQTNLSPVDAQTVARNQRAIIDELFALISKRVGGGGSGQASTEAAVRFGLLCNLVPQASVSRVLFLSFKWADFMNYTRR